MKNLLIVVDYQNDFIEGSLALLQGKKIENNIEKEIIKFIKNKDKLLFLLDTHQKNYLKTIEGKNLPIPHAIVNTKGWQVYGKIKKYVKNGDILTKDTFGCKELIFYLEKNKFQKIFIVGLLTNMCVLANAIIAKSVCPNTEIFIKKSCIASNNKSLNMAALKILKNLHIKIV